MISDSTASVHISVDYSNWGEFINYSSATERLKNFKYKLDLIEGYEEKLTELDPVAGSIPEIERTKKTIRETKKDFDRWESYMYEESGSKAIPKSYLSSRPYINYAASSSTFETWYDEQLISASVYDKNNVNMLSNTLPRHIAEDEYNDEFVLFCDMIGQHFDTHWVYIKSLTDINIHHNDLNQGISRDIVPEAVKNIGINLQNGTDARRLWRHYLGTDSSGSFDGTGTGGAVVGDPISSENYTKEIWRRLLANMPYLLKTKGTARSIKAIMACYGIPSTVLSLREYGGPTPKVDEEVYYYTDEFAYALNLGGGQYVSSSWSPLSSSIGSDNYRQADTIEIRHEGILGKEGTANQRQVILEASSSYTQWGITAKNNSSLTDKKGYYTFWISSSDFGYEISSSELEIFDARYRNIM